RWAAHWRCSCHTVSRAGCSAASLQHPLIQTDIENYNMESIQLPGGLYHNPRGHRLGGVLMEVVRLKLNCFLRLSSLTCACPERHGPCCPALSWMDSRRVAGLTCGAHLWIIPG